MICNHLSLTLCHQHPNTHIIWYISRPQRVILNRFYGKTCATEAISIQCDATPVVPDEVGYNCTCEKTDVPEETCDTPASPPCAEGLVCTAPTGNYS